jgi:hypothetical protein
MEVTKGQRQAKTQEHQVEARIKHAADTVWRRLQRARGTPVRPETSRETVRLTIERAQEVKEWTEANHYRRRHARPAHDTRTPLPPLSEPVLPAKWGELLRLAQTARSRKRSTPRKGAQGRSTEGPCHVTSKKGRIYVNYATPESTEFTYKGISHVYIATLLSTFTKDLLVFRR